MLEGLRGRQGLTVFQQHTKDASNCVGTNKSLAARPNYLTYVVLNNVSA